MYILVLESSNKDDSITSFMVWTIHPYHFVHRIAVSGVYLPLICCCGGDGAAVLIAAVVAATQLL